MASASLDHLDRSGHGEVMVSPPRLLLLAVAVVLVGGGLATATARAAGTDDARATAAAFFDAVVGNDGDRACALLTPAALERLGGTARCKRMFTESESARDAEAFQTLARAYAAARRSAAKHHGRFLTKQFTRRALARDLERRDPQLTVKLGRGPQAATGQLVTTVILDTRSTARRVVFYAESDDGSIFRLSAAPSGNPDLDEVGFGVPEANPEPMGPKVTFAVGAAVAQPDGKVLVFAAFTVTDDDETETYPVLLVLAPNGSGYLVDDIFYSALAEP
jgi:hypothetical protein